MKLDSSGNVLLNAAPYNDGSTTSISLSTDSTSLLVTGNSGRNCFLLVLEVAAMTTVHYQLFTTDSTCKQGTSSNSVWYIAGIVDATAGMLIKLEQATYSL